MSPLALTRAPPSAPSPTGRQGPWQVRQDVGRRHREGAQVEAERHPQEVGGLDPLRPECPDAPRGRGDAAPLGGPWGRVCWYPGWGAGAGALERRLHAIPSTCDFGCAPRMCVRPRYQVACACAGTLLPETRSGVSVVAAPNSTVCPTDVSSLARGRCAVRLYIKSRVDHTAERTHRGQRAHHSALTSTTRDTQTHTHDPPPDTASARQHAARARSRSVSSFHSLSPRRPSWPGDGSSEIRVHLSESVRPRHRPRAARRGEIPVPRS